MVEGSRSYRVLRKIGSGAFGEVFLAESVGELRRQVAIKVLNEEMAKDADIARRLRDEARILSSLNHRAIVRAEDLVRLNDRWCIVMEYVAGCDLAELPRPLPLEVALEIGEEIASALHKAASSRGLVHRDIKPANVRITPDGDIKLLDFGVARAEVEQREAATQNLSFGTKEYAAPEQFLGQAIPASDIYALAVMLFELATAKRPGSFFNSPERRQPGVDCRKHWEYLAKEAPRFADLLHAAMDPDPQRRPSARDLAFGLREQRRRLVGPGLSEWAPQNVHSRGPGADPAAGTLLTERKTLVNPVTHYLAPLLAGGLATVVVVGGGVALLGGGWLLWSRWTQDSAVPSATQAPTPVTVTPVDSPQPKPSPSSSNLPTTTAPSAPDKIVVPTTPSIPGRSSPIVSAPASSPPAKKTAPGASPSTGTAPTTSPPATKDAPSASSSAPPSPPPVPPSAPTTGIVVASDQVRVTLNGPAAPLSAVPAGTYTADVAWPDGTVIQIPVTVQAGKTTVIACSASKNCRATVR